MGNKPKDKAVSKKTATETVQKDFLKEKYAEGTFVTVPAELMNALIFGISTARDSLLIDNYTTDGQPAGIVGVPRIYEPVFSAHFQAMSYHKYNVDQGLTVPMDYVAEEPVVEEEEVAEVETK